jgi:lipopolysaccharide biosynthesis protein
MTDLCIFAHYDHDDRVDPYVMNYLEAIKACGFEIVFVTPSALQQTDVEQLRLICGDVILRANVGHDFGSWATGLQRHRERVRGRLLLANDSVYGPFDRDARRFLRNGAQS